MKCATIRIMHYYQPLNEDIVDVLRDEQDEEDEKSSSEIINRDEEESAEDFQYVFKFCISSIPRDKKETWYLEKMEAVRDILSNIIQISRNIEESQMSEITFTVMPYWMDK